MLDLVRVYPVFVIAGVFAFDIVQHILQLGFHSGIRAFRARNIRVLGEIGRRNQAAAAVAAKEGARGQPAEKQQHDKGNPAHNQAAFPMPDDKERRPFGFLRGFLRRLCGGFGGLFRFAARFQRFCILLFNALLLPKTGNGV